MSIADEEALERRKCSGVCMIGLLSTIHEAKRGLANVAKNVLAKA